MQYLDDKHDDHTVVLYMIVGIPPAAYCAYEILERNRWRVMERNIKNLKRDSHYEMYLIVLLDLVNQRGNS
jgi:hypothetical protein